jgi:hypothetical protein
VECTEDTLTMNNFKVPASTNAAQLNMINGIRRPRMITPPGQVERWRLVHAGVVDEAWMGLYRGLDSNCEGWSMGAEDTLQLHQISRDGITLPQSYATDFIFLVPGYRIEAVLGGEGLLQDGDTWCLVAASFVQGEEPVLPSEPPTVEAILDKLGAGDVIAILNVTSSAGSPSETTLPSSEAIAAVAPSTTIDGVSAEDRCAAAAAVEDAAEIDQVAILQVGFWTVDAVESCDCPNHNVNCKSGGAHGRSEVKKSDIHHRAHGQVGGPPGGAPSPESTQEHLQRSLRAY